MGFLHDVWKTKGQEMVDAIKEKRNERRRSRSWCEMIESTESGPHKTSELVAYHKLKRKFLSLADIQNEDPNQLVMYEFRGEDFVLVAE